MLFLHKLSKELSYFKFVQYGYPFMWKNLLRDMYSSFWHRHWTTSTTYCIHYSVCFVKTSRKIDCLVVLTYLLVYPGAFWRVETRMRKSKTTFSYILRKTFRDILVLYDPVFIFIVMFTRSLNKTSILRWRLYYMYNYIHDAAYSHVVGPLTRTSCCKLLGKF